MSRSDRAAVLLAQGLGHLARWGELWKRPRLEEAVDVEITRRLSRSLGRTHPGRRLIRISDVVLQAPDEAFAEVLCHEAAHIVIFERHRRGVRPHGPQWAALVCAAGYEPRTRVDPRTLGVSHPPTAPQRRGPSRYVYEHRCATCGMTKQARRAVTQWRCARCRESGLEGELEIRRWRAR